MGKPATAIIDEDESRPLIDRQLDDAWIKLKYFIGNRDEYGHEKDPVEDETITTRYKLTNSLRLKDPTGLGYIPFSEVAMAFGTIQLRQHTGIDDSMLERLLRALQCINNEDRKMINYNDILRAPYQREDHCQSGVFPKIVSNWPF
jgi:hypothetical protein